MDKTQHWLAFTLAEILITLSIIGVVAALTIPSLVVKNQEKETVVQLKKAYNVFSNAFSLAVVEYGDPSGWGFEEEGSGSFPKANKAMDKLAPFLNLAKRCYNKQGCYSPDVYKYLNGQNAGAYDTRGDISKAILNDGMSFNIWAAGGCSDNRGPGILQNSCGLIEIDVNGFKKPNVIGKDLFSFNITKGGIIPVGTNGNSRAISSCSTHGNTCAAWVILKGNMDYLKGPVSWD